MKKLLTFFAMMVAILLLPVRVSAWWDVDASHPGTIIGSTFQDVDGNSIDIWNAGADNGIPLVWVAAASEARALIKATGDKAYLSFSVWDDYNLTYKKHSLASTYSVSTTSDFTDTFAESSTQTVVEGLESGKLYQVCLKQADDTGTGVKLKIRPIPDNLYMLGDASEWGSTTPSKTDDVGTLSNNGKGVFTFNGDLTSGKWMRISSGLGSWTDFNGNAVTNQSYTDGGTFTFEWPLSVGDAYSTVSETGKWTITFNFATGTVTSVISSGGDDPDPEDATLTGIEIWDNWDSSTSAKGSLTKSGSAWTGSLNLDAVTSTTDDWTTHYYYFKLSYSDDSVKYGYIYSSSSDDCNQIANDATYSTSTTKSVHTETSHSPNTTQKVFGLTTGGTTYITLTMSDDDVSIVSVAFSTTDPSQSTGFTLDANTAPTVKGWNGTDWGGGWSSKSGEAFTLESSDPVTWALEFTASSSIYFNISDSNGDWYYNESKEIALNGSVSDLVKGERVAYSDGTDNGQQIHATGVTSDNNYVLRLTQTDDGVVLTLSEPYAKHAAPAVTVTTTDGKGVFTISATLADNETLWYSIDGGEAQQASGARQNVTVEATSTLTAWVVDANGVKGNEKSLKWTNPADVTNPVTKVELYDNDNKGYGYSKAELTKSGTSTWSADFAFKSAPSSSWTHYYFLKLTYEDGTTRYAYLGTESEYDNTTGAKEFFTNIVADETYTTSSTPVLYTKSAHHEVTSGSDSNARCVGFGLTGGDGETQYRLTITLDDKQENVATLKVTEPVIEGALPTTDWTLSDESLWTKDSSGNFYDKYFYISWNQNDNRVSPEWELERQDDGTYLIDNFMVIPDGHFRLRKFSRAADGSLSIVDYGMGSVTTDIDLSKLDGISSSSVVGEDGFTGAEKYSGTATMLTGQRRGFRWNVGFTIASVKFDPTNNQVTYTIDLSQPSTLKQASKPGIPYVAMMGSNVKVPAATGQNINYALTLNDNVTNTAYTNAWVQYDEDGSLYRYGDLGDYASYYRVSSTSTGDVVSSGTPAKGQVMNSTRVPPVNLISLAQDIDGTRYQFTSRDITFKYAGVVSDQAGTINGVTVKKDSELYTVDADGNESVAMTGAKSGTRFAAYTIESINLNGLFKIFNGYGAHTYGDAVNGLSLFANWGVKYMNSDDGVYQSDDARSGEFAPLSGGGAMTDTDADTTGRGKDGNDTGGVDNGYEDNNAGKYINFSERSYVWKATFYYALESDGLTSESSDHYMSTAGNNVPKTGGYLNSGRNNSWIHFNFQNAPASIELALTDNGRGKPTWSINGTHQDGVTVSNYTVKVYRVDSKGDYLKATDAELEDLGIQDSQIDEGYKELWPTTSGTTEYPVYELANGTWTGTAEYVAEGTTSTTTEKLPVGRYIAVMTYQVTENGSTVYRVISSNLISVVSVDADPVLAASQRMEGNAYTFDVVARPNINALYKDYVNQGISVTPDVFSGKLTFDYVIDQGSVYVYNSATDGWDEVVAKSSDDQTTPYLNVDEENGTATVTFPAGTFTATTSTTQLYFPRVRVLDYIPGSSHDFTFVLDSFNTGTEVTQEESVTQTVQIQSPRKYFSGVPQLLADHEADYNYVKIVGSSFPWEYVDESLFDGNTSDGTGSDSGVTYDSRFDTASRFYVGKLLTLATNGQTFEFGGITYDVADIDRLPYITVDNASVAQAYEISTSTYYVRDADKESNINSPSNAITTTLTLDAVTLNAPREGIADMIPTHKAEFVSQIFDGKDDFKTDGETAKDFVTIVDNYTETYGGANRIVEDAYIAAQLTAPTDGLVYHMPLDDVKMGHHPASNYNPNNHHKASSEAPTVASDKAPGVMYVEGSSISTTELNEGRVWWAVNPTNSKVKDDFEQRYYKSYENGNVTFTGKIPAEPKPYWAGCAEDVTTMPDNKDRYITHSDGEFDRIDPYNGLYGTRNHQVRKGWHGGEPISFTFFRMMFGKGLATADDGSVFISDLLKIDYDDSFGEVNPVFKGDTDAEQLEAAKAYFDDLAKMIETETGTNLKDSKVKDEYAATFAEETFVNHSSLATPYAMLRVCHVNHESWWASTYGVDATQAWFDKMETGKKNFTSVCADMIKFPTEYYTPVQYDMSYTYPFLSNYVLTQLVEHVDEADDESSDESSAQSLMTLRSASGDSSDAAVEVTSVKAQSTGMISFDSTSAAATDIVTAVESVEAEAGVSAISISYDRATGIASVTAPEDVKAVNVYDISGKQYGPAVVIDGTAARADLGQLGAGVYTVQAVTSSASKTVKVQK